MEFPYRSRPGRGSVALLPGAWNPPTEAHLALAVGALQMAEEVLLVVPRRFPHKQFEGPAFETRVRWLVRLASLTPGLGVAISEGGLFIEIARELRSAQPGLTEISVVCGRDAAERIVGWDYGGSEPVEAQLQEFRLLVAPRCGVAYEAPPHLASRIGYLPMPADWHDVSSTTVREGIARGSAWRMLVPGVLADEIGAAYAGLNPQDRVREKS